MEFLMIRRIFLLTALLAAPAFAHDHDHADHVAEAEGIRAIHAWSNATTARSALVFVEIENLSDAPVTLTGAETAIAAQVELVGLQNRAGSLSYVAIPELPIAPGTRMVLAPNGVALQLGSLSAALTEGEHFDMELHFGETHLDITVEIESATATQHSHAGHQH